MRELLVTLLLFATPPVLQAAGLVANSDFSARPADDASVPSVWSVPRPSPWHSANDDGYSGADSLRYRSRTTAIGKPVTQTIVLSADTTYVLTAAFKTDGRLHPLVRVRAGGNGAELVRLVADAPSGVWQQQLARFTSKKAGEALVEVWIDTKQSQGYAAPAGTAVVDDVQVLREDETDALAGKGGTAVAYENIARGRPYTLNPRPSYPLCTDPADKVQLTDGQYTAGYFWTQKSTVGWSRSRPIIITLDLEDDLPIRGISFNSAAGVAGVEWPTSVSILVSVDGRVYHSLGDLVELSSRKSTAPTGKYSTHRFWTDAFKTHGRYVKLLIDPDGPYCFADELEVYRGANAWTALPLPGEGIHHPAEYFQDSIFSASVKRRLGTDLITAQKAIQGADLSAAVHKRLMTEAAGLADAIGELPEISEEGFRAVFPLNNVHERIFAVHGAIHAAEGRDAVIAWNSNPWDLLNPTDVPEELPQATLQITAMRGETRCGTINLTNGGKEPLTAHLSLEGLPGSPAPACLTVHEVAWTDTREGTPVAAALPEAQPGNVGFTVNLPAGLTRQIWFSFKPEDLKAGVHKGSLVVLGAPPKPMRIPVELRVLDLDFPEEPTLHVGGWDYTDCTAMYGVTQQNRGAFLKQLQDRYVDSPWATRGVMPYGRFTDSGEFTETPNTSRFDTWLERWPDARRYCVFAAVTNDIAGTTIDEAEFSTKVGNWIRFWVEYAESRGIDADQLYLLLVDEPHRNEQDAVIVAWAKAIKAAEPHVVIWEDPTYRDVTEATPELMAASDVLCPNRPMMLAEGKPFVDFYLNQRKQGRRLDLYSCSGPGRLLDPYAYHRLQAWACFEMGAEGTFFWAFGDNGNGNSWNEYVTPRTSYTPFFLGPDVVTAGKHMEAIRESVEDFEYLVMLRDRVEELSRNNPGHRLLPKARRMAATALDRVLHAENVNELSWKDAKDRSIADTVRIEIGLLLEELN